METLLTDFRLDRPTWFYLSLLLIVAVYFRFNRVWSLRNLDLILLLALSPGLLLIEVDNRVGFVWLFGASAAILVRLILDPLFVRRPRLPQNLNVAGLTFLLAACATFHVAETLTTEWLPASAVENVVRFRQLMQRQDASDDDQQRSAGDEKDLRGGPTATMFSAPAVGLSQAVSADERRESSDLPVRIAAILAHASLVGALVVLGWRLFGELHVGVAMATLYLLLPCTAYNVAQINHVLPCALILWAIVCFRNPFASGGLLGLACGTLFFPVFLLPIWMTFYGWRNSLRFGAALGAVWVLLLGSMTLTAVDANSFVRQVFGLFDASMLRFSGTETTGVWAGIDGVYRMPVFALFVVMIGLLSWWTPAKSLESLLTRSAAVIVGIQFWYPQEGGVYVLWYVPLLLAIVFRPSLTQLKPPAVVRWPWRRHEPLTHAPVQRAIPAGAQPARPLFR